MSETIRIAAANDIPRMVELAAEKRTEYESYQPVFWHPADDARTKQKPFFEYLLRQAKVIALVHDDAGIVDGFVIATPVPAPPVYNPGGPTCFIDDFTVAKTAHWEDVGRALLREALRIAKERGAAQAVVVCGHLDEPKRAFLRSEDLNIASE
jgi:GNAT superfamily N-acetyltransferase